MTMGMVEKVARAIDGVQLFIRYNDWASDRVEGSPVEICRYGRDDEPEIVVVRRFGVGKKEEDALYEVVSEERARAAIAAMREPSKEMVLAGYDKINENIDFWNYDSDTGYAVEDIATTETWHSMIDAALNESEPR
jgi:hypothetical protein